GTLTLAGNIVHTVGGGTETTTITLDGSVLDMGGFQIGGAASQAISFNALSGTLKNLSEVNGGGLITKTPSGALTLDGNNTFAGGVSVSAGTLNIKTATAIGSGTLTLAGGTTIDNTGVGSLTLGNNLQVWNGNFTFTGTNDLNLGTGAVSLGPAAGTARTVTT